MDIKRWQKSDDTSTERLITLLIENLSGNRSSKITPTERAKDHPTAIFTEINTASLTRR
jgi:hypothetical protein